jgi:hypothetical protein
MALNTQIYPNYLRPTSFFEDLARPCPISQYKPMDPFHFFENNLMREILLDLNDSDDHESSYTTSAVARPRLPYAKFSAGSLDEAARFLATRPNSHDVSDNDEQTSQTPQVSAPVVDVRARRPPGNLTVVVNRPIASFTGQQRAANRRKLNLKRQMDRVFDARYDVQNENCLLSCRLRSLNSSNLVEFILGN